MKVKCLYKTGANLLNYENRALSDKELGRFGATGHTIFDELVIGKEYLVMGIIVFQTYQAYLIDDGLITTSPCQLFEVIDEKIYADWGVRTIDREEDIYPFIQMIIGYPELRSDKKAYEKLIIEQDEDAQRIYFKRKVEAECLD